MVAWIYKLLGKPVPYYAKYPLWLTVWKPLRKFINVVIIPNIPFNNLRILLYRMIGFKIGKNTFIGMRCYMDDMEPNLTIIGNNITISYCCIFAIHGKGQTHTPIIIEDDAYIGAGSLLFSGKNGITIGRNVIIGGGERSNFFNTSKCISCRQSSEGNKKMNTNAYFFSGKGNNL